MKLIKKLKIENNSEKNRQVRLFEYPILEYKKRCKRGFKLFPNYKKEQNPNIVVYLKVNAIKYYSLACIQNWINIADKLGYDYYIICDKEQVKEKIEEKIIFPSGNIKFIKSTTNIKWKMYAGKFSDKNWYNAALAHLTTFQHSKKINARYFWNIDADDTAFLTNINTIVQLLHDVENYSSTNNIPIFSLDMWRSWSKAKHWSFGISFTDNHTNWEEIFNTADKNWHHYYDSYCLDVTNLDWFFTYLKDCKKMDIQTFYIENMRFIHFCDFGGRRKDAGLCYWENGFIHYPLYEYVLKDTSIGILSIPDEIVKFHSNTNEEECLNFYKAYIRGKK